VALRVLVVSDVRLHREGVADILQREGEIEVVGTAAWDNSVARHVAELCPDVLLLDVRSIDGSAVAQRIAEVGGDIPVVVLAVGETGSEILAWAEAGARGYIAADCTRDDVARTLRSVAHGETVYPPRIVAALFRRLAALGGYGPKNGVRLTDREKEILELMRRGSSNKQIPQALVISYATVKNHVHNILEKLGATGRQDAVARWHPAAPALPVTATSEN